MNILVINPMLYTAPLKGAPIKRWKSIRDTMIVDLCKGFVANGDSVTLIASEEYKPLIEEDFGFSIIYLENTIAKIIKRFPHGMPILKGLKKFLKDRYNEYDIVISSELFTPPTLTAAKVCPQKLLVWQEFGFHLPTFKSIPSKIWHRWIVGHYFKNKVLVVPRSSVAQKFVTHYCNRVSSEIVNNCINTELFIPTPIKKDYLIILSRLIADKNIEYILERYISFRDKYPQYSTQLRIIGDGPIKSKLQSIANACGYSEEIHFMGRMPHADLAEYLAQAKGFLCCTNAELNMISMTESIVAGTPILTNCVPQQYELVRDENLGIAKDNWNEDDIAKLIDKHIEYSSNCIKLRNEFSNKSVAKAFVDIFVKYNSYAKS